MKMTDEQIEKVTKLSQIPDFPYDDFSELKKAANRRDVTVGAAMDFARQWLTSGDPSTPKGAKLLSSFLMSSYLLLPLALVVYAITVSQFGLLVWLTPTFLSFLILRPMMVRTAGFLKLIIFAGYALVIVAIFKLLGDWSLWLGLSITLPWLINKIMYKSATKTAIKSSLTSEKQFVKLFKYNVVALYFPNGDMLWGSDCIERKID